MTAGRAAPRPAAHRRAAAGRAHAAVAPPAAGRAGDVLDARRTLQAAMHTEGMPLRLGLPAAQARAAQARLPVRRVGLDGAVRPRDGHVPPGRTARAGRHVEAFAFGTRISRLTPQLRELDPVRSLRLAGAAMPDWGGGTRIGESLRAYNEDVRAARPDPRRGRRRRLGRLGARRPRAARHRARAPAPPGPPAGVGEPAEGPRGVRAAGGRDAGRAAPLGRLRRGPQPGGARGAGRGVDRALSRGYRLPRTGHRADHVAAPKMEAQ